MPSAREVRAKLLERKLAARRRESEAEFERSRAGVVVISSGKLNAKAKHIKPRKTQEGEVFRMQALVLGELIAEGVGHFSPKPNNSRTAKAERREAKFPTADASSYLKKES